MVVPFIAVTTSPGFVAAPPGMFSHSGMRTVRLTFNLRAATALRLARTVAAFDHLI